jgi:uncharacterized protein YceK
MIMRLLVLVLLVAATCGCAATERRASSTSGAAASAPRVRCLSNPHETGTRPLVFLLCVESP